MNKPTVNGGLIIKKLLVSIMVLILSLSLAACGGEAAPAPAQSGSGTAESTAPSGNDPTVSQVEFVSMTFGDFTMSIPSVFGAV